MTPDEAPSGPTRRGLLRRGLIGGLLLSLGGAGFLALRPSAQAPLPASPLLVLTPTRYSTLMAVLGRIVPDGVATLEQRQATAVRIDATLSLADARTRDDVTGLLGLLENALAGLVLDGTGTPFTRLDPGEQEAVLEAWRHSRVPLRRTGYQALRRLAVTHFYADPANQAAIGYPGPPKDLQ